MNWGQKLKDARKRKHITQQELADYLGVHRTTIANYEMTRRKPTIMEFKKLASKLGVDLNYLLEGSDVNVKSELLSRASTVFKDVDISNEDKDKIFQDIMKIYLAEKERGRNGL